MASRWWQWNGYEGRNFYKESSDAASSFPVPVEQASRPTGIPPRQAHELVDSQAEVSFRGQSHVVRARTPPTRNRGEVTVVSTREGHMEEDFGWVGSYMSVPSQSQLGRHIARPTYQPGYQSPPAMTTDVRGSIRPATYPNLSGSTSEPEPPGAALNSTVYKGVIPRDLDGSQDRNEREVVTSRAEPPSKTFCCF